MGVGFSLTDNEQEVLRFVFENSFDGKRIQRVIFERADIMPLSSSRDTLSEAINSLANRKLLLRDDQGSIFHVGYRISRAGVNSLAGQVEQISETVDSSTWTGRPNLSLSDGRQARLARLLIDVENALDVADLGNAEKAMARAYVVAARSLAEAPDPPADLIWELISRANSLAGIASLLVSVIALFMAANH